MDDALLM